MDFIWSNCPLDLAAMCSSYFKRSSAYQYEKFLLEETEPYITKELKKMAEEKAKTEGQEQISKVRTDLGLSPQPEHVVLGTFQLVAQASEPQHPTTVQHNVPETATAIRRDSNHKPSNHCTTNTATATECSATKCSNHCKTNATGAVGRGSASKC